MDKTKYSQNLFKLHQQIKNKKTIYIDFIQNDEYNETSTISYYRRNGIWEIRHYYCSTEYNTCSYCGRHSKKKCGGTIPKRITSKELFLGLSEIILYVHEDDSFDTHNFRIVNNDLEETNLW